MKPNPKRKGGSSNKNNNYEYLISDKAQQQMEIGGKKSPINGGKESLNSHRSGYR